MVMLAEKICCGMPARTLSVGLHSLGVLAIERLRLLRFQRCWSPWSHGRRRRQTHPWLQGLDSSEDRERATVIQKALIRSQLLKWLVKRTHSVGLRPIPAQKHRGAEMEATSQAVTCGQPLLRYTTTVLLFC